MYRTASTVYAVLKRIVHPKVVRVFLQTTYDCNQRCKTCDIWTINRDNPSLRGREMSLEEVQKFSKANPDLMLTHPTGGEPFLKKDYKYITESLLNIPSLKLLSITSNGSMPSKIEDDLSHILRTTKNRLATVAVQISFEGPEKVHDEITGIPGSYQKARRSLGIIQSLAKEFHQLRPQINYTFSKYNPGKFRELLDSLGSFKPAINNIEVGVAYSSGYCLRENREVVSGPSDYLEDINWLRKQYRWRYILDPISLFSARSTLKRFSEGTTSNIGCSAAKFTCVVDPYWNVSPCVILSQLTLGNLKDYGYNIQVLIDETEKTWKPAVTKCFANGGCKSPCELHVTTLFKPWKLLF